MQNVRFINIKDHTLYKNILLHKHTQDSSILIRDPVSVYAEAFEYKLFYAELQVDARSIIHYRP